MSTQWIPNYIRRNMDYHPNEILTAQEYNAILNLLIAQGDYNSEWLDYLQTDAIPEAIADISAAEIAAAISTAVTQAINALAASVVNKTCLQLNDPAVTILNVGAQYTGIAALKTLLDSKSLTATYAVPVNLIGQTAYPTLAQLNALKTAGNDIVACGTDGTALTDSTAETIASACKTFVTTNGFNTDVFVYPAGTSDTDVIDIVGNHFKFAANSGTIGTGVVEPEYYYLTAEVQRLCNIPVIEWDNTVDIEDIKDYIDAVVDNNEYVIIQVNTDAASYDATDFEAVLDYIQTKDSMTYPDKISNEMRTIFGTIGNRLKILEGIYLTEENGDIYLNW